MHLYVYRDQDLAAAVGGDVNGRDAVVVERVQKPPRLLVAHQPLEPASQHTRFKNSAMD